MNLQQPQPGAVWLSLHPAVWRRGSWDVGLQLWLGFEAMYPAAWYRPDGWEFCPSRCVHDFTAPISAPPLPYHQMATHSKGCFSDHFALIKYSCHNSGREDACKTFLPCQNKAEKLFKKSWNLWSLFSRNIGDITFCHWQRCSIATQIKSWLRLKKHQPSKFCHRKHLANQLEFSFTIPGSEWPGGSIITGLGDPC